MQPELADARRVLVARLDNLGDVVLTGPFARAVRAAAPDARLSLLASPGGAQAAPLLPWYDEVIVRRAVWQDIGGQLGFDPARELDFVECLRVGRWDAAFVLTSFSQTSYAAGYAAYLAGIPVRVGHAPDFGGSVLSHPIAPPPDGSHQAERNLHLLDELDVPVHDRDLSVVVPADDRAWADAALRARDIHDAPFVAIVPGASCAARRWPAERYGAAARVLSAAGLPVVVLGSEREGSEADSIIAASSAAVSLVGRTSIGQLAAVVERAAVVLCGNSLALHLADALRRPVVALYSGTERESEWGPRATAARLLRIPTACAPCRRFTCPFDLACLDLDPTTVATRVLELAGTAAPEGRCVAFAS